MSVGVSGTLSVVRELVPIGITDGVKSGVLVLRAVGVTTGVLTGVLDTTEVLNGVDTGVEVGGVLVLVGAALEVGVVVGGTDELVTGEDDGGLVVRDVGVGVSEEVGVGVGEGDSAGVEVALGAAVLRVDAAVPVLVPVVSCRLRFMSTAYLSMAMRAGE